MAANKWSVQPLATGSTSADRTLIIQNGISKQIYLSDLQATSVTKIIIQNLIGTNNLSFPRWYYISDLPEPLYVLALSADTLDTIAYSPTHPMDIIYYNTTDALAANWFISYREDTIKNLSAHYDWRTIRNGRYNFLFTLGVTIYPLTNIVLSINTVATPVGGTANSDVELTALIAATIKTALGTDYVYNVAPDTVSIQQTVLNTSGYEYLAYDDGALVPQNIVPVSTPILFYTFNNNINFSTNTFEAAPDGNGGGNYSIRLEENCGSPLVGGDQNIFGQNNGENRFGAFSPNNMFGNYCGKNTLGYNCNYNIIKEGTGNTFKNFCTTNII